MAKRRPFSGMTGRFPTMHDITRVGKTPAQPVRSVGGSGHRAGRGAEEAVTQGTVPGIVPGQTFPKVDQGGTNGTG
jgi:hypothetical protein